MPAEPIIAARRAEPWATRTFRAQGAILDPIAPAMRFVLRAPVADIPAIAAASGWPLATEPLTARLVGARAALNLGPDEWLLIDGSAPEGNGSAAGFDLVSDGCPHSLVEVSHRQLGLQVSGASAATLLESGCPLDLAEIAFPVGRCTRTVLGKVEITLWRTAPEAFRVEFWRSYATYAWHFLEEAAAAL